MQIDLLLNDKNMFWDEDEDLLVGKKSAPKQGRRSNKLDDGESTIDSPKEIENLLLRTRKNTLWSDEPPKSSRSGSGTNMIELERFQNEKKNESDDDIPIIPDLDDIQDDALNIPDIKPVVSVNKSTYKELDSQFTNMKTEHSNFGNLSNIDLSFLTRILCSEKDLQTSLDVWTLDSLFQDLSRTDE